MQHGVHVLGLAVGQQLARRFRRHDDQFDLPPRRFLMHVRPHRQVAIPPGADDQSPAAPGQVLPERQRRVAIRRATTETSSPVSSVGYTVS